MSRFNVSYFPVKMANLGVVIVFFALLVCACDFVGSLTDATSSPVATEEPQSFGSLEIMTNVVEAHEKVMTNIYNRALPSVVEIKVQQKMFAGQSGFQFPQSGYTIGEGSGFVWDDQGHIVTNYHVVRNADHVKAVFSDGTELNAEMVGADPDSDLAVLKVDSSSKDLFKVKLGESSTLKVGQFVMAIGSPFGQEFSMTLGIVSALGRTIRSPMEGTIRSGSFSIPQIIQTDAPINPGNSGGPLLDSRGRVIGINTQIISNSGINVGVGFAVPINTAKRVVPVLISGDEYIYAFLGVTGITLKPEIAVEMGESESTRGALIVTVIDGGPAMKAGIRGGDTTIVSEGVGTVIGGDIVIAIDGVNIDSFDDIIAYLVENKRPGDSISLDLIRGNKRILADVVLGIRP